MKYLLTIDQTLFLLVNHLPHVAWSDTVAKFFSGIGSFGLVWFVIGLLLFFQEENKHHRFFVPILSVGAVSYLLSEIIIKSLVGRIRPTDLRDAIVVAGASGYSFPSTHATVSWAMATVFAAYEPRARGWWYSLALCISFSRMYLGVHYPIDVAVGAVLGWGIARAVLYYVPVPPKKPRKK